MGRGGGHLSIPSTKIASWGYGEWVKMKWGEGIPSVFLRVARMGRKGGRGNLPRFVQRGGRAGVCKGRNRGEGLPGFSRRGCWGVV